jgi:ribosomal protein S27E
MGLPHHSGRYFKDHPTQYYQSPSRTESPQYAPVMTAAEFIAWHKAIRRQFLTWTFLFIAMAFVTSRVCSYMDRAKPAGWIQILAGCGIISAFVIFFVLWNRAKHNVKKRGFKCPACGNEITGFSGLAGWPQRVLCNRCGTKVIEFNGINWKTIAPP